MRAFAQDELFNRLINDKWSRFGCRMYLARTLIPCVPSRRTPRAATATISSMKSGRSLAACLSLAGKLWRLEAADRGVSFALVPDGWVCRYLVLVLWHVAVVHLRGTEVAALRRQPTLRAPRRSVAAVARGRGSG